MHRDSIFMHRGWSCIVEDHAPRTNIHAPQKIMYRESIFMHREKIFMTRRELCIIGSFHVPQKIIIMRIFYTSQKFMHREKIPCLIEIYASQEDLIPHRNYASREDLMPHRNYASREDIHAWQKFMHRRKIFIPRKKSCTARGGIVHLKGNIYPSTSIAFLFGKSECQENHRKQRRQYQHCINVIYFDIQWRAHRRLYCKHKT